MSGIRSFTRRPTIAGFATFGSAPVYVDSDDNILKFNPFGVGTTEVQIVDTVSQQSLQNKVIGYTTTTPLTAHAGGGQSLATQLNPGVNVITVAATAADSVKLPLASLGAQVTVVNNGASAIQVFGAGTDTINGIATATGISQAAGTVATYFATASAPAGNWNVQVTAAASNGFSLAPTTAVAADGALDPNTSATYVITKTSAAALTLAAPSNPASNGVTIVVVSDSAFAHTITTATLFNNGLDTNTTTATYTAQKGATITLMAYLGRWSVISRNAVTVS